MYLKEDFFTAIVPDGLYEFRSLRLGSIRKPAHGQLDHLNLSFFALPSSVHQIGDHLVEFLPSFGIIA